MAVLSVLYEGLTLRPVIVIEVWVGDRYSIQIGINQAKFLRLLQHKPKGKV
ncbi:hypothetical protein [Fischerella sp. PCC 9605]|uniref:hypothetical protein n=1 Tax=Fischerella sp. PCC 9605 TaxID=1173024 RepID=UPI0004BAA091|nr:hypothetical protein [Fischerella sp. PCC 9605]